MAELLSPGVFVQEVAGPRPVQPVGTSTAAFVGVASKGPVNAPTLIGSAGEFDRVFGGLLSHSFLGYSVHSFFDNGGSRCYVVRSVNVDGSGMPVTAAAATGVQGVFNNHSPSSQIFTMQAVNAGAWGNLITVSVEPASTNATGPDARFALRVFYGATPVQVELFDQLSMNPASSSYYQKVVNGNSEYITTTAATQIYAPGDNVFNPEPHTVAFHNGVDGVTTFTSADISASINTLDKVLDVNMLVVPDAVNTTSTGPFSSPQPASQDVVALAKAYADKRGDLIHVVDTDPGLSTTGAKTFRNAVGGSNNAALYYPWIEVNDPLGSTRLIPPSGAAAGIMARTDSARGVFKSPAGMSDGAVRGAISLESVLSQGDQDTLNPIGVNVIRNFSGAGNVVWGARTLSADSQWRYLSVRRLLMFIEQSLKNAAEAFVFESNTPALWGNVSRDFSGFLRSIWNDGGLFGTNEDQAFFVKVDESNNPASSRALGRLVIDVGVAPVKPAEFIVLRIAQQVAEG